MSRGHWKHVERYAAVLMGAQRYPANMGGRADFEGPVWIGQAKNVQRLSLSELEALAVEMDNLGAAKNKLGVVVVKRSAGRGQESPHLIVMTDNVWGKLSCSRSQRGRMYVVIRSRT